MTDSTPDSLLPLPTAVFHILIALADRDRHGYSIMQDVAARTGGKVQLSAGTLYSSIRRMLEQGVIEELADSPDPSSTDERRRYYRLTRFGRRVAAAEVERLNALLQQARATGLVRGDMMRAEAIYRALAPLLPGAVSSGIRQADAARVRRSTGRRPDGAEAGEPRRPLGARRRRRDDGRSRGARARARAGPALRAAHDGGAGRASPRPRCCRWRSASAPTPPSSTCGMACCMRRCRWWRIRASW